MVRGSDHHRKTTGHSPTNKFEFEPLLASYSDFSCIEEREELIHRAAGTIVDNNTTLTVSNLGSILQSRK